MSGMIRITLAALFIAFSALLGCHQAPADPRSAVFPSDEKIAVGEEWRPDAALTVLYWPDAGKCEPCELPALRGLAEAFRDSNDIELIMVLSYGRANPAARLGVDWPGEVVRLDEAAYSKQMSPTPLPRVEVWDRGGRLLLLKAVPPNLVRAEALGDEVLWAKARALPGKGE